MLVSIPLIELYGTPTAMVLSRLLSVYATRGEARTRCPLGSYQRIANASPWWTRRQIEYALVALEEKGILSSEHKRGLAKQFYLHFDRLETALRTTDVDLSLFYKDMCPEKRPPAAVTPLRKRL